MKKNVATALAVATLAAITLSALTLSGCSCAALTDNTKRATTEYESTTIAGTQATQIDSAEKLTRAIMALVPEGLAYYADTYSVGDVTPGDYAFIKFQDSGYQYRERNNFSDSDYNYNFTSFGYVTVHGIGTLDIGGVLISVDAFERLGVSGAKEIYEILNEITDYNAGGNYKVGADIPAGEYELKSVSGKGFCAIMDGPYASGENIKSYGVESTVDVTLEDGQYLEVSKATFTKK